MLATSLLKSDAPDLVWFELLNRYNVKTLEVWWYGEKPCLWSCVYWS